jgi:hypothetical protein
LTSGKNPHTIGIGGDIATPRPLRIERAFTRLPTSSTPVDYMMDIIDNNRYQEIIVKNILTSYPAVLYYEPAYPLGNIYTYPVQGQANLEIHLSCWMQLTSFTTMSETIELPAGYDVALKYQLAVDISPTYGKPLVKGDNVYDRAAHYKSLVKRINQVDNNIQLDSALLSGNRNMGFSILRGF